MLLLGTYRFCCDSKSKVVFIIRCPWNHTLNFKYTHHLAIHINCMTRRRRVQNVVHSRYETHTHTFFKRVFYYFEIYFEVTLFHITANTSACVHVFTNLLLHRHAYMTCLLKKVCDEKVTSSPIPGWYV